MIDSNILSHKPETPAASSTKILFLLAAVVFFVVNNATMINVARPLIGKTFWEGDHTLVMLTWIVTGYMLSFGIFNAIDGRLADVFGIRRIFLIGTAILGLTSLVMGFAPSLRTIIVFRMIQGTGAAALPALSTAIIARVIPPENRGWAMGTIVATTGIAASAGLFLGGALVQLISWRAVFFFTSSVLLMIPIGLKILPASLDTRGSQKFDLTGAITLAATIGCLFYAFVFVEESVREFSAATPGVTPPLFLPSYLIFPAIGIVFFALFVWRIRSASHPLLPPLFLTNRAYLSAALTTAFANVSRFGAWVMVPQILVNVHHVEPVTVAFVLLPGELAILFLSSPFGKMSDKLGSKVPVSIGLASLIISNILFAVVASSSMWWLAAAMLTYGLGLTAVQTPLMSSVSKILPPHLTGIGMGIFMMLFFSGGGVGSAIWNTVFALQTPDAASWIGIDGGAARYSNSVLVLGLLPILGLLLLPFHPKPGDGPIATAPQGPATSAKQEAPAASLSEPIEDDTEEKEGIGEP